MWQPASTAPARTSNRKTIAVDAPRFDQLARVLSSVGTRRGAFGALLAGALGLLGLPEPPAVAGRKKRRNQQDRKRQTRRRQERQQKDRGRERQRGHDRDEPNAHTRKRRKAAAEGPCGNGSAKANECSKDKDCCTRVCDKKKGRCRCQKLGRGCTEDRNCCANFGQPMTCQNGACQTLETFASDPPSPPSPSSPSSPPSSPLPCQPESPAQTCNGTCGSVANNCGAPVDCGPCACEPRCPFCQTCDAGTGQCVPNPDEVGDPCGECRACAEDGQCTVVADGIACDDGNACTQTDTCQGGVCVGSDLVACTAIDQCHDAGACDLATGACSTPKKADGAACNDGDACTRTDTCRNGVCVGGNPVVCPTPDQCHDVGACDPTTGTCSDPTPKAPNTPCDDGEICTVNDVCTNGVCAGTAVVCDNPNACQIGPGACDPDTGGCIYTSVANGAACPDDGVCCNGTCCSGCCGSDGSCGGCVLFVSSTQHTGDLGGLAGADAICQDLADKAPTPLPGTYKAWLSTGTGEGESPATRFRRSGQPYQAVNGLTIADDWADLTDGTLDHGIYYTEAGKFQPNVVVWTNTGANGAEAVYPGDVSPDCDDWTSADEFIDGLSVRKTGRVGTAGGTGVDWTESVWSHCAPDGKAHLYCFQQE